MKTYSECIPCFYRQAEEAVKLAGADGDIAKIVLAEVSKLVPKFSMDSPPPVMAEEIHHIIRVILGKNDPYSEVKRRSNDLALKIYPELKKKVERSGDRLLIAVELAIAGNIIDYGVKNSLDIRSEIETVLSDDFSSLIGQKKSIFEYDRFRQDLSKAETLLYLADNAGEIVFDRILIEELKPETVVAVRGRPIINDALIEDALACGIDKCARLISNGSAAPGTILEYCSREFLDIYEKADIIISKGQGNFETLNDESRPIYFLFKTKCPVVARDIGAEVGSMVLKKSLKTENG